jgi:membrane protein DedA with SNARE-associated domain
VLLAASVLSELSDAITSVIGDYGLYAVFWLMFVDAVLPAASELVMVYGGALAAGAFAKQEVTLFGRTVDEGWPAYLAIVLAGTVGYTLGSMGGWAIGFYGGRPYLERHGRWLHLNAAKLDKAERWFERWEDWAVFLGRLTPLVRSFVSVPAGVFEAPFVRYTVLTFLGSTVWCALFAGAGFAAGESWEDFHHAFRYVEYLVAVAIIGGAAWLGWRYLRRRRARVAEDSPGA